MEELNEKIVAEKIKNKYLNTPKEKTKLDEIKDLDKKVKNPALIFAYVWGTIGTLVLGLGMSFALKVLGDLFVVGIIIGIAGIIMISITYPIYKMILKKRKERYGELIIEKSNELLND